MADNGKPEASGPVVEKVDVLTVYLNRSTLVVTMDAGTMSIAEGQMILAEAMRLLEEQRRVAAMLQLQAQAAENARINALIDQVRKGN